ncbi:MAG: outer membrane beta-barrel protein [Eudoraea sp.]|uniref:outer membrane beta-barrel protein n=1 Tax=Eudoraea sp. TaxID=1979955 RepID=UPI0032647CE2
MKLFTNTSYIKNLFLLAMLLLGSAAFAQEEEEEEKKKISFSGSVDAYYRTNFNGLNSVVPIVEGGEEIGEIPATAPGSSFANDNGFAIGMVNFIAGYEGEKVGFVADLVFGPRGEDAVFNDSGPTSIVNQLYVYWNVSDKVTLTLGNFNTFLGYEVISPVANFNYSTSYMFSYGPFSHTGLKADFDLGNDWSAMVAILNQTDFTSAARQSDFSFGAQLGYAGQFLNFLYGKQGIDKIVNDGVIEEPDINNLFQIDYTGGFNIGEDFFLGINATYQDTGDVSFDEDTPDDLGFYGVALYPQYTFSEVFTLGLRGEYFEEIGDFGAIGTGVEDSNVFAVTLSGNVTIGNYLKIIPEIRLDNASDDAFLNKDLETSKSLSSFLLAAVFAF